MNDQDKRLAWLRERQTGIGSSDAPSILGIGFRSPAQVLREKLEPILSADVPETGILRRGLELEPTIAAMYGRRMGTILLPPAEPIYRHAERSWQLVSPDRVSVDGRVVQLKSVTYWDGWGPEMSDEIPDHYRVERVHEMGVLGVDSIDVIALNVVLWEPRIYRLEFDRRLFDRLTQVEAEFWDAVQARTLPADWDERHDETRERFALVKGKEIELPADLVPVLERRARLVEIRKQAEAAIEDATETARLALGDAEVGRVDGWRLKRSAIAPASYTVERDGYERLDIRREKRSLRGVKPTKHSERVQETGAVDGGSQEARGSDPSGDRGGAPGGDAR